MTVKVKLNPNQFSTVACRYPLETKQVVYSDEERDLFLEEAKNWRVLRFRGDLGVFDGDYAELFGSANLSPSDVLPLDEADLLIEDGKLVGVGVTCGVFDTDGVMGGWSGWVAPLLFEDFEDTVRRRGERSYTEHTRHSCDHYCSALIPASILETIPGFSS